MQILDLRQTDITQSRFYQEIRTEGRQDRSIIRLYAMRSRLRCRRVVLLGGGDRG